MHFPRAVEEALKLCYPIGERVGQAFLDLREAKQPAYVVDINSPLPEEVRCPGKRKQYMKRQLKLWKKRNQGGDDSSGLLQTCSDIDGDFSQDEEEDAEEVPL